MHLLRLDNYLYKYTGCVKSIWKFFLYKLKQNLSTKILYNIYILAYVLNVSQIN